MRLACNREVAEEYRGDNLHTGGLDNEILDLFKESKLFCFDSFEARKDEAVCFSHPPPAAGVAE